MIFSLVKARPRKTIEDFMRLPEGTRAELIKGELFKCPSPRDKHQNAVGNLFAFLRAFVRDANLGRLYIAPFDVHLPSGDIVEPDIIYVARSNADIVQEWIRGVPDLVVEVISPEGVERDRIVKRDLYARNGIREYWIVDPQSRTVEVFSLAADRYEPNGYFEPEDVLASPLLAEFEVQVSDIFE